MPLRELANNNVGFKAWPEAHYPTKPTILMIHGAGGRSEIWNAQIRPLGRHFNAIAIDLPAHGKSPGESFTEIRDYAQWLSSTIASCFDDPVILMGHSMGGAVCQELALQRPDLLRGIILVATGPRLRVAPAFLEGLRKEFEKTVGLIIKYAYSTSAPPVMLAQGAELMKESGPEVLYNDFAACDRFDCRDRIKNIATPTLIICGENDKLTPPALSQKLAQEIDGSRVVIIPEAGHMVMIEAWKHFNDAVADFVNSL